MFNIIRLRSLPPAAEGTIGCFIIPLLQLPLLQPSFNNCGIGIDLSIDLHYQSYLPLKLTLHLLSSISISSLKSPLTHPTPRQSRVCVMCKHVEYLVAEYLFIPSHSDYLYFQQFYLKKEYGSCQRNELEAICYRHLNNYCILLLLVSVKEKSYGEV